MTTPATVEAQPQLTLPLCATDKLDPTPLVAALADNQWHTATQILKSWGHDATESEKRSIRAMCAASKGKVTGGQLGYKLTKALTPEEFHAIRNEKLKARDAVTQSVIDLDNEYFTRKPVGL